MRDFDAIHVRREPVQRGGLTVTEEAERVVVARFQANSQRDAAHRVGHDYPAPPSDPASECGWVAFAVETPLSILLRQWQDIGDLGWEGREDDYDALILAAQDDLLDDARGRLTMLALCDLAEELCLWPDLMDRTRAACGTPCHRPAPI